MMQLLGDNLLNNPGVLLSASSTGAGTFIDNIHDGNLYDYWQSGNFGQQTIAIDLGESRTVNALALIGHTFYSSSVTTLIVRQLNNDNELLSSDELTIAHDNAELWTLTEQTTTQKIEIKFDAVLALPRVACLYVGRQIQCPRSPAFGNELPWMDNQVNVLATRNTFGLALGSMAKKTSGISLSYTLRYVPITWAEFEWCPFIEKALHTPFFVRLSENFSQVIYATLDEIKNPSIVDPEYCHLPFKFTGSLR
ncbi:hypothetical protein [Pleionea sediminis]|uniref:hypothetical protein n=1 Tax=Pleionea sediminis TaxID=2569479 RepID=UPI001186962A|nr:hypothetical protein [Pleionea sediminis]